MPHQNSHGEPAASDFSAHIDGEVNRPQPTPGVAGKGSTRRRDERVDVGVVRAQEGAGAERFQFRFSTCRMHGKGAGVKSRSSPRKKDVLKRTDLGGNVEHVARGGVIDRRFEGGIDFADRAEGHLSDPLKRQPSPPSVRAQILASPLDTGEATDTRRTNDPRVVRKEGTEREARESQSASLRREHVDVPVAGGQGGVQVREANEGFIVVRTLSKGCGLRVSSVLITSKRLERNNLHSYRCIARSGVNLSPAVGNSAQDEVDSVGTAKGGACEVEASVRNVAELSFEGPAAAQAGEG